MKIDIDLVSNKSVIGSNNLTKGFWKVSDKDILVIVLKDNPKYFPLKYREICKESGRAFTEICDEMVPLNLRGEPYYVPEKWELLTYNRVSGTIAFSA